LCRLWSFAVVLLTAKSRKAKYHSRRN
jgi:hypothetical protein